mgnify:CR=1 FL=1
MKKDNGIEVLDLSELCSKAKQDEGVWFQMETNDGLKWDIDVLVYGNDSDKVQLYERAKMKERMKRINVNTKRRNNIEFDDNTVDSVFDEQADSTLVRFGGIKKHSDGTPLKMNGKEFPVLKDDGNEDLYRALLEGSPDIADFVLQMSKERSDFLAAGKKN